MLNKYIYIYIFLLNLSSKWTSFFFGLKSPHQLPTSQPMWHTSCMIQLILEKSRWTENSILQIKLQKRATPLNILKQGLFGLKNLLNSQNCAAMTITFTHPCDPKWYEYLFGNYLFSVIYLYNLKQTKKSKASLLKNKKLKLDYLKQS